MRRTAALSARERALAVVVTGSAGFIGGHLVRALVDRGHDVVAVDRMPGSPAPGVRPLLADLTHDDPQVRAALRRADAVFHLAARPGVRDPSPDVAALRRRDNVRATQVVLSHVPDHVPLVVTSSSSVYGGSTGRPCRETDPVRPQGGYARSKVAAELLCLERLARGGTVAVARPFTVVGEGQRPDMALARWLAAVDAGRPVTVYGGLHRTRDVTDVHEVVRGLLALAERRVTGVVNLGTGVGRRLCELLAAVAASVGREPVDVRVLPAPAGDVAATLAHTRHCAAVLGFVPTTDLAAVVERQAATLRTGARSRVPA